MCDAVAEDNSRISHLERVKLRLMCCSGKARSQEEARGSRT